MLGSVEVGQFMNLWQKFKQAANKDDESEDEIKKSFEQFDLNGDGFITKDEITQVRLSKSEFVKLFAENYLTNIAVEGKEDTLKRSK